MRTVLYLGHSKMSACALLKFRGAQHRLLQERIVLRKISFDCGRPADLADLIDFWEAKGLIVDCCGQRPPVSARHLAKTPSVLLDLPLECASPHVRSVSYDIRATCHLAARELLSLDCATYAYAGYGADVAWSRERHRVFAQALRLNGHSVETFSLDPGNGSPSRFYRRLTDWLRRLKRPIGILAADDAYALHLHSAVQKLGLHIPADVAILGVDDESDILTTPGLSSIQLDFNEAGRLAAELLLDALHHPAAPPVRRRFGPVQLLRRSSTRKLPRKSDNSFASILQRIREQAPHGLSAAEVISWLPGSRRLAETRFRQAVGHSILEEITAVRIDRAKELLTTVNNPIGEIAELCGYRTFNAFRNAFKAQTGLTPKDWRRQKKGEGDGPKTLN